jgi:hypothetical protein
MSNVHPLPQPDDETEDTVFFKKHQLRVGTALRYHGRTDAGALWFVTGIYTTNNGRHVLRAETFPQTLTDLVRVQNHQTKQVHFLAFQYLSYSAIWEIDERLAR